MIDATGTEAIIVRPDAGVKTIKDLKGKALLTTANAGVNTFFPRSTTFVKRSHETIA